MRPKLRFFLVTSAGDAIGSYKAWSSGQSYAREVAVTYSEQFFELCSECGAEGYVISDTERSAIHHDGGITVEHRSTNKNLRGIGYHLGSVARSLGILYRLLRFRPQLAIISDDTLLWILLIPARLFGTRLCLSLHVRLWAEGLQPKLARRLVLTIQAHFLRRHCAGGICVSRRILEQVKQLAPNTPFEVFKPTYRANQFQWAAASKRADGAPFRVAFVGRLERNKGVFDLLDAADQLVRQHGRSLTFDICGSGAAEVELGAETRARGLEDIFRLHGFCNQNEVLKILEIADVVVVPTRSEFLEGYNKVAVEAVLAGRPVITSRICPALEDIRPAAIEVEPDEWRGYARAIEDLYLQPEFHLKKQRATHALMKQYLRDDESWKTRMASLVRRVGVACHGAS